MDKKNISGAIEILENGIKNYPYFPPAYIIMAKAYAVSGNYKLSLDALKTSADLMHSKKTYDFYVREIEGIRRHHDLYNVKDNSEHNRELSGSQNKPGSDESMKDIDDRLEELAREISSSKISPAGSDYKPEAEKNDIPAGGGIIVSETLAKIYISQGEIEEAKKVYLKLIQKHPEREAYYRSKIDELPSGLES